MAKGNGGAGGADRRGVDDGGNKRPASVKASLSVAFGQRAPNRSGAREEGRGRDPSMHERAAASGAGRAAAGSASPEPPPVAGRGGGDREQRDRDRDRERDRSRDRERERERDAGRDYRRSRSR